MNLLSSWTDEYSKEDSLRILTEFSLQHANLSNNPALLALVSELSDRLQRGRDPTDVLRQILDHEVNYDPTRSVLEVANERQALAFFAKSEFLDLGFDRAQRAFDKFVEAEAKCRETNIALRAWTRGDFQFPPDVEAVFYRAAKNIQRVLCDVPELNQLRLRFGPGATTRTKRREASARSKLSTPVACSEDLVPYVSDVLAEMPLWSNFLGGLPLEDADSNPLVEVLVEPGKLGFVPKNAKTDRSIVTEPSLNGMVQLGIGGYIADRLRAFGVDLRDQSLNQRLALEGSLTGALATLDLSSASDTVSLELVFHLLPIDWALFLARFRSGIVTYKGDNIKLEKFSSMGNGYTFALESLIFWGLVKACCDPGETFSIYGDDIICPTHKVELVSRVLAAAGFSLNREKSFTTGCFRESCGADYFRGFDIRPCYHKTRVSGSSLFVLHNFYVRTHQYVMSDVVLYRIHPAHRIFGPDGFGDGHLLGDWHPRPHKREIGYSGYLFDTFTRKSRRDRRKLLPGDGVLPAYSIYLHGESPEDMAHATLKRAHGQVVDRPASEMVFPGSAGYKRISIYTLTN